MTMTIFAWIVIINACGFDDDNDTIITSETSLNGEYCIQVGPAILPRGGLGIYPVFA